MAELADVVMNFIKIIELEKYFPTLASEMQVGKYLNLRNRN